MRQWVYRSVQLPTDMELPGLANLCRRWFFRERQTPGSPVLSFYGRRNGLTRFVGWALTPAAFCTPDDLDDDPRLWTGESL